MREIKVYSVSLGCPKNRVDAEAMLGSLGGSRITLVDGPEEADVALINTCAFIQPAVEESIGVIFETASRIEEAVQAGKTGRKPILTVTGCLVSRYGEALRQDMPEADLLVSTHQVDAFAGMVLGRLAAEAPESPADRARLRSTPPSYAYLKIGEGCSHKCSFCAIPSIRGPLRSRPVADLTVEARQLLDQGVKELILVAQDLTAWGRDLDLKGGLRPLLDALLPLDGLKRLRLMYLYPSGLTEEFLRYLRAAGEPLVPYFDVPLQHAHPDILRSMGRPFAGDPMRVVDRIRDHFPEGAVRTSLIVGYPGEGPKEFKALKSLVEQARFHHLGVFTFWPEEGTAAAEMAGRPRQDTAKKRRDELMNMQAEISEEILEGYVGRRMSVLVDEPHPEWPGLHLGRTWFQAPEADGATYVSGPGVKPGAMVEAVVEEAKTYDLVALSD